MADVEVTTTFPEEIVPTLQSGLAHYNQQHGTSLDPKGIMRVAVIELLGPHAAAAQTEPINAQASDDVDAIMADVQTKLEAIT